MSWNKATITDTGAALLNESLAGHKLTISGAMGGAGTSDEDELPGQTGVIDQKQTFKLLGIDDVDGGKRVGVQITNEGLDETYTLHQIGVTAKLDSESEEQLLLVFQDERGVEVPTVAEGGDFLFEVYAIIAISNKANITINADSGVCVTQAQVKQSIDAALQDGEYTSKEQAEKIAEEAAATAAAKQAKQTLATHNTDESAHKALFEKAIAQAAAQAAANAGGALITEISIPESAWALDESTDAGDEYRYCADVSVEGTTADMYPDVALDKASFATARRAKMCPTVESLEGALRFWAKNAPEADMSATVALLTAGGTSGTGTSAYTLPVATTTTLGGVKVGTGLKADSDGTLSVDDGTVATDADVSNAVSAATASDAETEQLLNEKFGES